MNGKVKFKPGDVVYHKTRDLGRGTVRYVYRAELLVVFENWPAGRYPKEELCKADPHRPEDQSGEWPRAA